MGFNWFWKTWFDFVANLQETVDGSSGLEQKIPVEWTGGLSRSEVDSMGENNKWNFNCLPIISFFPSINIFNKQEMIVESLESNMETMFS